MCSTLRPFRPDPWCVRVPRAARRAPAVDPSPNARVIADRGGETPQAAGGVAPRALLVQGFTKRYDGQLAVEDLSFAITRGEILGLVGPNGAGKTTTLRSIAGILPLRDGRVVIDGHDLERDEVAAKGALCWVPDDPQPFETLTVEEHLEFTASLYRLKDWRARADDLIERFELAEKRKALGGELSRGMRQKLAYCCAWLPRPGLLLMDEPLSGLDPRGIRSSKLAIREIAAEGTAVLLSSHLLELIEELAHRILILDRGRRVFMGTLAEARASIAADEGSSLEEVFMAVTGGVRELEGEIVEAQPAGELPPAGEPPREVEGAAREAGKAP